ncbi:MAG: 16S rRNA (adenine(1518)-N(6)/adenine(1519)-N(6))-dimethyltransferase RsmA [Alphaproteobacteria bacterium]|nr:MAG: 16S rRNA (adenine(1518)-N(6)/adenine(1519)-N(6))-dimethyltransferase RsmA [Alphaproteobacteria bacterium]
MTDPLPPLREVIRRHGLSATKALGQNFLLDLNLTRRIARTAGSLADTTVYEVGAGPGGLTRALLMEGAARVVAVERDRRCIAALEEVAEAFPGRLEVIEGDALEIDERALLDGAPGPVRVVANLPYNIGTALLTKWLTTHPWPPWFQSLTLMFQREVAERIVAPPGTKAYGRLAVLSQFRCEAAIRFTVPRQAFVPPPKVTSAVVQLEPRRPAPESPPITTLERVTMAAFGQRRKMLRSSLKQILQDPEELLDRTGISPTARAEDLSVADFVELARALEWISRRSPPSGP